MWIQWFTAGTQLALVSNVTYTDAMEEQQVSRSEVLAEIHRHGAELSEFDSEVKPDADGMYDSAEVLGWLGY